MSNNNNKFTQNLPPQATSGPPTAPQHAASRSMRIEDLMNTDSGSSSGNSDNGTNDDVTLVPVQPVFAPIEPNLPVSVPFTPHKRGSQKVTASRTHPTARPQIERPPLKCPFSECSKKIWFPGFANRQDLEEHLLFHRCQWSMKKSDGFFRPCMFVPQSEQDAWDHAQSHIEERDSIPSMRNDEQKLLFFCPWSMCNSNAYCVKGTANKAHILLHLKKHLGQQ